ncbi:MAG: DUF58 domain-containing protein [Bacteroidales bacterium]|nr:DUF58 domain-containing protein [Bacteroidales bacterium]
MSSLDLGVISQFGNIELIAKQLVEGFITGLHQSPFHGFSVEFAEYRPYNAGESTRNIDWKLYGRTDKLFIEQYEEETNLRCQLLIDVSSSMRFPLREKYSLEHPNKLWFSVYAAAAIIQMLRQQRDAVGLTLFDNEIRFHSRAKSSPVHVKQLFAEMEKVMEPQPATERHATGVVETLHEIAERIHRRSLVVVFSDMFDFQQDPEALFLALQHLRHSRHEVILFEVCDHSMEVDFALDNRPYRLIDMESGREMKLNASEIKELYRQRMQAYREELKVHCGQYQIDLVEADINEGFQKVLMTYFLKRKRMQ